MSLAIDHLGLAFAGYIFFGAVIAVVLGRILGLNDRLARGQFETHGRERIGIAPSPTATFHAERSDRPARALAAAERSRARREAAYSTSNERAAAPSDRPAA